MIKYLLVAVALGLAMASTASNASNEFRPSFSPDGRYLAFHSDRDGDNEIYRLDLQTGEILQLTNNDVDDADPDYSPDGQYIAFYSGDNSASSVFMMPGSGGEQMRLTSDTERAIVPVWSPDGSEIYFQKSVNGSWEFHAVRVDDKSTRKVSSMPGDHLSITFFPDSDRLLFSHVQPGESHDVPLRLYSMNTDGSDIQAFMAHAGGDSNPQFSPDGSRIVFNALRDLNYEIYIMDSDSGNQRRLTHDNTPELSFDFPTIDGQPTWSPDGSAIAFTSGRKGEFDIYLINPESGWLINLTGHWQ